MTIEDKQTKVFEFEVSATADGAAPNGASVFLPLASLLQHEIDPGYFWWYVNTGNDLHVGDLYVKLDPGTVEHWYLFKNTGTYNGASFGIWVTPSSTNSDVKLRLERRGNDPKKLDGTPVTKGSDWAAYLTAEGVQNTYITSAPTVVIP